MTATLGENAPPWLCQTALTSSRKQFRDQAKDVPLQPVQGGTEVKPIAYTYYLSQASGGFAPGWYCIDELESPMPHGPFKTRDEALAELSRIARPIAAGPAKEPV